jgi:hypothetical protein
MLASSFGRRHKYLARGKEWENTKNVFTSSFVKSEHEKITARQVFLPGLFF